MPELSPILTHELRAPQLDAEVLARELRRPASTLAAAPAAVGARGEPPGQEHDVRPFVMAVRGLIESERLDTARQMLYAAPPYILSDPLVARLRSILAPPVVKRVHKRDLDRRQEYDWLRTHGHQYRGQWVALDGATLLVSAATLRELQERLRAVPVTNRPFLHRVD
ncbi:MAG: hypothetical protein HYU51_17760 [Candidatus Rokubacteria bacterium]|nr:hypothetical protein [Candidatus Rokubacteria bacterium]